ncbi:MAG: ArsR/SmtB family transcription factor [Methyloligellaceae bacterium]
MQETKAAAGFSALGNATRLAIFRILIQAGAEGCPVGTIQHRLEIPLSTLAHHLSALVRAGLVAQQKSGREVICMADYDRLNGLVDYLKENCCIGVPVSGEARDRGARVDEVAS